METLNSSKGSATATDNGTIASQDVTEKVQSVATAKPKAKEKVTTPEKYAHTTLGFGVPATSDPHHFVVTIPKANNGRVVISENLGIQANNLDTSVIDRVALERQRWTAIRSEVQRAFNAKLKEHKLKTSAWKAGDNPVDRLLGKELCVIAWAIEGMAMENIPIAVRNWLALRPEERWWLFGMAALSTGGIGDAEKGWRLALRHALGDVAQAELLKPRSVREPEAEYGVSSLNLFD
jgi:hypothetical protein